MRAAGLSLTDDRFVGREKRLDCVRATGAAASRSSAPVLFGSRFAVRHPAEDGNVLQRPEFLLDVVTQHRN